MGVIGNLTIFVNLRIIFLRINPETTGTGNGFGGKMGGVGQAQPKGRGKVQSRCIYFG